MMNIFYKHIFTSKKNFKYVETLNASELCMNTFPRTIKLYKRHTQISTRILCGAYFRIRNVKRWLPSDP